MRFGARLLGLLPALVFAVGALVYATAAPAGAATPTVTMFDNDARSPGQGFDPAQGWWGFAPAHIEAKKGDMVVFHNPGSNRFPHTVTNLERTSGAFENQVTAGTKFDSSPSREALVTTGNSWALDTSMLDPGHYPYYCRIHPWMVASITVME